MRALERRHALGQRVVVACRRAGRGLAVGDAESLTQPRDVAGARGAADRLDAGAWRLPEQHEPSVPLALEPIHWNGLGPAADLDGRLILVGRDDGHVAKPRRRSELEYDRHV